MLVQGGRHGTLDWTSRQTECTLLDVRQVGEKIRVNVQQKGERNQRHLDLALKLNTQFHYLSNEESTFCFIGCCEDEVREDGERAKHSTWLLFSVQEMPLSGTKLTSRSCNPFDFHHIQHLSKDMGVFPQNKGSSVFKGLQGLPYYARPSYDCIWNKAELFVKIH